MGFEKGRGVVIFHDDSERRKLEIAFPVGYVICSILVLKYNGSERTFRQALSF